MEESAESRAATSMVQYLSVLTVALEMAAQVKAERERDRADRSAQEAAATRAELRTRYARDRLDWEPLLDPRRRASVSEQDAARAWCTAQAWNGYPEAEKVAQIAEEKARGYAPDLMRSYDYLRDEGVSPLVAMSEATAATRRTHGPNAGDRSGQQPHPRPAGPQRGRLNPSDDDSTSPSPKQGTATVPTSARRAGENAVVSVVDLAAERYERPLTDLTVAEAESASAALAAAGATTPAPRRAATEDRSVS